MGICDLLDGWDDGGPNSERFEELADFVNDLLEEWGFDRVDFSDHMPPGEEDSAAVYMSDTDTVHLNPDILSGDPGEAIDIAIHEGLHASVDQLGWDDMANWEEEMMVGGAGSIVGEELREGCEDPTESGNPSDMPDYPWQSKVR